MTGPLRRNPHRMTPDELAEVFQSLADEIRRGAQVTGAMSVRPAGGDDHRVQGHMTFDDGHVVNIGEWAWPGERFGWHSAGFVGREASPPGIEGPDVNVVRTVTGHIRYYRLPDGNWCHAPERHLAGTDCPGITWTALINSHGAVEEDETHD